MLRGWQEEAALPDGGERAEVGADGLSPARAVREAREERAWLDQLPEQERQFYSRYFRSVEPEDRALALSLARRVDSSAVSDPGERKQMTRAVLDELLASEAAGQDLDHIRTIVLVDEDRDAKRKALKEYGFGRAGQGVEGAGVGEDFKQTLERQAGFDTNRNNLFFSTGLLQEGEDQGLLREVVHHELGHVQLDAAMSTSGGRAEEGRLYFGLELNRAWEEQVSTPEAREWAEDRLARLLTPHSQDEQEARIKAAHALENRDEYYSTLHSLYNLGKEDPELARSLRGFDLDAVRLLRRTEAGTLPTDSEFLQRTSPERLQERYGLSPSVLERAHGWEEDPRRQAFLLEQLHHLAGLAPVDYRQGTFATAAGPAEDWEVGATTGISGARSPVSRPTGESWSSSSVRPTGVGGTVGEADASVSGSTYTSPASPAAVSYYYSGYPGMTWTEAGARALGLDPWSTLDVGLSSLSLPGLADLFSMGGELSGNALFELAMVLGLSPELLDPNGDGVMGLEDFQRLRSEGLLPSLSPGGSTPDQPGAPRPATPPTGPAGSVQAGPSPAGPRQPITAQADLRTMGDRRPLPGGAQGPAQVPPSGPVGLASAFSALSVRRFASSLPGEAEPASAIPAAGPRAPEAARPAGPPAGPLPAPPVPLQAEVAAPARPGESSPMTPMRQAMFKEAYGGLRSFLSGSGGSQGLFMAHALTQDRDGRLGVTDAFETLVTSPRGPQKMMDLFRVSGDQPLHSAVLASTLREMASASPERAVGILLLTTDAPNGAASVGQLFGDIGQTDLGAVHLARFLESATSTPGAARGTWELLDTLTQPTLEDPAPARRLATTLGRASEWVGGAQALQATFSGLVEREGGGSYFASFLHRVSETQEGARQTGQLLQNLVFDQEGATGVARLLVQSTGSRTAARQVTTTLARVAATPEGAVAVGRLFQGISHTRDGARFLSQLARDSSSAAPLRAMVDKLAEDPGAARRFHRAIERLSSDPRTRREMEVFHGRVAAQPELREALDRLAVHRVPPAPAQLKSMPWLWGGSEARAGGAPTLPLPGLGVRPPSVRASEVVAPAAGLVSTPPARPVPEGRDGPGPSPAPVPTPLQPAAEPVDAVEWRPAVSAEVPAHPAVAAPSGVVSGDRLPPAFHLDLVRNPVAETAQGTPAEPGAAPAPPSGPSSHPGAEPPLAAPGEGSARLTGQLSPGQGVSSLVEEGDQAAAAPSGPADEAGAPEVGHQDRARSAQVQESLPADRGSLEALRWGAAVRVEVVPPERSVGEAARTSAEPSAARGSDPSGGSSSQSGAFRPGDYYSEDTLFSLRICPNCGFRTSSAGVCVRCVSEAHRRQPPQAAAI